MLNWFPIVLFAKQVTKFAATILNALFRWRIVISGPSSILEMDSVVPLNINYRPVEYYFHKGFDFMIPNRDEWDPT